MSLNSTGKTAEMINNNNNNSEDKEEWETVEINNGRYSVQIRDLWRAEYGSYTWPASYPLAEYLVLHKQEYITGKLVLELGAGTGLPGLLSAQLGARCVLLTDRSDQPHILDNLRLSVDRNLKFCPVQVHPLDWGSIDGDGSVDALLRNFYQDRSSHSPGQEGLDLTVLGSDLFYDSELFESVLVTFARIKYRYAADICGDFKLANVRFLVGYHVRSDKRTIQPLLDYWQLSGRWLDSTLTAGGNLIELYELQ